MMNSLSNNIKIRIENKVSEKPISKKLYVDNNLYNENMKIEAGKHNIKVKSIFYSKETSLVIDDGDTVLINFRANAKDKVIIGLFCIIIVFPFFYIGTIMDIYPIIPALLVWLVLKVAYNPVVIKDTELEIRKL